MNRTEHVRVRHVPHRLRGWGGVAGMAVACALTAAAALLPLSYAADTVAGVEGPAGRGVAQASPAKADTCDTPEASVRPSDAEGPTLKDIKERDDKPNKLIVGIDQNSYRWGYRDPTNGDLEGFDIDLVHRIAEDLLGDRDDVVFRAIPTNMRIDAIKSGEVDMVVRTMTINCDRLKDVAFSTAYFETGQQLLVPKGSTITGYDDSLNGRKVCSAKGSTAESELRKKSFGADIDSTVANQLDCLVQLQLGRADAVVTDSALAAGQAAQDPTVKLVGEPFTQEYYGVAMKKGADDLVAQVNQVLVDYRRSGWTASYNDWLEEDMGKTTGPPKATYRD